MTPDEMPLRRRRWLRYRLRTIMAAVTVFCIFLGHYAKQRRDQQLAVASLRQLGATIYFDYFDQTEQIRREYERVVATNRGAPTLVFAEPSPPGPQWLRHVLGDDYFANVHAVRMPWSFRELDLSIFTALPHVKRLSLGRPGIVDDDLRALQPLDQLESLGLTFSSVTDEGLRNLKPLVNLKVLSLGYTKISDAGLVHLGHLKKLEQLELSNTNITDAGLVHLRNCGDLRALKVRNTQVTDAGVEEFQRAMPNCRIGHSQDDWRRLIQNGWFGRRNLAKSVPVE